MVSKSDWAGELGTLWATRNDDFNRLLEPAGRAGLRALGNVDGLRVLDVGCGGGQSSRELTKAGAKVTGVDVSWDMLDLARSYGGDEKYMLVDASKDPLGGPYDGLYSRFGAQFFDDPVQSWSHIRSHMHADGRAVVVVWCDADANPWASVPARVFSEVTDTPPYPFAPGKPGPFAWGDPEFIRSTLSAAGWTDIALHAWQGRLELTLNGNPDPLTRAVWGAMHLGPVSSKLRDAEPAQKEAVAKTLRVKLAPYLDGDVVRMPAAAWVVQMWAS